MPRILEHGSRFERTQERLENIHNSNMVVCQKMTHHHVVYIKLLIRKQKIVVAT